MKADCLGLMARSKLLSLRIVDKGPLRLTPGGLLIHTAYYEFPATDTYQMVQTAFLCPHRLYYGHFYCLGLYGALPSGPGAVAHRGTGIRIPG